MNKNRQGFWRRSVLGLVLLSAGVAVWSGCHTVPITGRKQFLIMPEQQEISMGVAAYKEIMAEEKPSRNRANAELVDRVGKRIAAVAGRPDYQWEFNLIESEQMNAFALPGGKVAVYEGILPVCQSEAGLAVVMSHEIAHALARHGGERMSQSAVVKSVETVLDISTQDRDERDRKLLMSVYGAASKYGVILPYSRSHEAESDAIGLTLMAKAGYDPSEAPAFWERFAAAQSGEEQLEFLSTHPSDATRAQNLRELLPKAMKEYEAAETKYALGEALNVPAANTIRQATGFDKEP